MFVVDVVVVAAALTAIAGGATVEKVLEQTELQEGGERQESASFGYGC